jgi:hypothetical protein
MVTAVAYDMHANEKQYFGLKALGGNTSEKWTQMEG